MPARLTEKPTWLISQLSMHGHRLLTERLATAGARGYHYRLLAALAGVRVGQPGQPGPPTSMDRSDVVAALNDLARLGLVQRTPDPADRRRNVIAITPAGPRSWSGSTGCWPRSRTNCWPRCHPASATS